MGYKSTGELSLDRPIVKGRHAFIWSVWAPWLAATLSGCALPGAPSFVIAGSYFPGWMFCALIGIVAAIAVRVGFVASGLASVLPFQLFVCAALGLCCGILAWLLWFGQ
jgi:YtcA family